MNIPTLGGIEDALVLGAIANHFTPLIPHTPSAEISVAVVNSLVIAQNETYARSD